LLFKTGGMMIVLALQEDVGLYVVDGILEEIRLGMEVCRIHVALIYAGERM